MRRFVQRVAIVTGATEGIGEVVARRLHDEGATVVIAARHGERARAAARALDPKGARALGVACDVTDPAAVAALVAETVSRFGALHLAVNNAGITGPGGTPVPDIDPADWSAVIATCLTGTFLGLKFQIPAIRAAGGGAIVNMASANALVGVAGLAAYTAAKHGVLGLTRSAALDCATAGIRINAVAPGYVDTPRMRETPPELLEAFRAAHPMRRLATRAEVAALVAFLLSDEAGFCTGGLHLADGGYTAA